MTFKMTVSSAVIFPPMNILYFAAYSPKKIKLVLGIWDKVLANIQIVSFLFQNQSIDQSLSVEVYTVNLRVARFPSQIQRIQYVGRSNVKSAISYKF